MFAIIINSDGTYYHSAVFGVVPGKGADDFWGRRYIVFNQAKKELILQPSFNPTVKPLLQQIVLITDADRSDWHTDVNGFGCLKQLVQDDGRWSFPLRLTADQMQFCLAYDGRNPYKEWQEIETDRDIDNFMELTWGLHDAGLQKVQQQEDGICLLFSSCWSFDLEIVFTNDVEYRIEEEIPNPYGWQDSTIIIDKGFVYLIEDEHTSVDEDLSGLSWFRGRKMAYHIKPKLV